MGLGDLALGSEAAAKGIRLANPIAGETVMIEKQVNDDGTVWFKLTKNSRTIGVLSKADSEKNRLSTKILQKEAQGYVLDPKAEIEYIVVRRDPVTQMSNLQVLCNIRMYHQNQ
jgi:hypothetical protein